MSGAPSQALINAVTRDLEGFSLEVRDSGREMTITDPRLPEKGCFIVDYSYRYLAWERQEYDYWHF